MTSTSKERPCPAKSRSLPQLGKPSTPSRHALRAPQGKRRRSQPRTGSSVPLRAHPHDWRVSSRTAEIRVPACPAAYPENKMHDVQPPHHVIIHPQHAHPLRQCARNSTRCLMRRQQCAGEKHAPPNGPQRLPHLCQHGPTGISAVGIHSGEVCEYPSCEG